MKMILLSTLAVILVVGVISSFVLTRDGSLKTPVGTGTVTIDASTFEAFPLPDYAAAFVDDDYKSYFIEVAPGIKMHILEVGTGQPVYMQHGVPTSGFLNRKVADALPRDQFRVIMPTLIGLGFSSKVPASQITLENQIAWTNTALTKLALKDVIFVGQDWGGPIGMGALARSPEMASGAVILNTVLDAPKVDREIALPLKIVNTPIVGELFLEGVVSIFNQLAGLQKDPASMPADVIALYAKPVQDSGNAKGPLALTRMAVTGPDHPNAHHFVAIEAYLADWNHPTEIVWGLADPILGKRLSDMTPLFPNAEVTKLDQGHFLQEEAPKDVAAAIQRVADQL
ncbi:alpha/beta fold hydrolase [Amylibacter sp. IMCC11727]|uniref:alpha/beta fold hydrolase n=1 Tax=Amylibacter sp. IMCC11727 TaxID=3039851 RepID=UPI00244D9EB4|nr:alpha/beta fold hydrolase [Amylibacter sp. IMCC11727]WGI22726.1 alpha/beta fold hydrolase [Amylibacter sp. IMCC11727]